MFLILSRMESCLTQFSFLNRFNYSSKKFRQDRNWELMTMWSRQIDNCTFVDTSGIQTMPWSLCRCPFPATVDASPPPHHCAASALLSALVHSSYKIPLIVACSHTTVVVWLSGLYTGDGSLGKRYSVPVHCLHAPWSKIISGSQCSLRMHNNCHLGRWTAFLLILQRA